MNEEIKHAVNEINQKHYASALAKKDPNMQINKALEMIVLTPSSNAEKRFTFSEECPGYATHQKEALQ